MTMMQFEPAILKMGENFWCDGISQDHGMFTVLGEAGHQELEHVALKTA